MSLFGKLGKLFDRSGERPGTPRKETGADESGFGRKQAEKWLAAMESGKLAIPEDVHDSQAWDGYWMAQIEVGALEQGFGDMMASDSAFVPMLSRRGARSVLCVGNGLSSEPYALALHGFDVTVLDVSRIPRVVFSRVVKDVDHPLHRLPGFTPRGEAAVAFVGTTPIDPALCPSMHTPDDRTGVAGGSLSHVTGDLIDIVNCPGPFDVVIERRTVQLFKPEEQSAALERLALRLGPHGLLVSHQHSGGWRPGDERTHFASEWVRQNGFADSDALTDDSGGRAAQLRFTSG